MAVMGNVDEEEGAAEAVPVTAVDKPRPSLHREPTPPTGLKLSCYEIDPDDGTLLPAELEDAIAARQKCQRNPLKSTTTKIVCDATPPPSPSPQQQTQKQPQQQQQQQQKQPSYWIDADVRDGDDARELHEIIQRINLSSFLKRHLAKPYQIQTPQVLSLSSSVFLVMRVLPPEEDTSNEMRYVAALCVKGLLLTVTTKPKAGKAAQTGHLLNKSTRKSMEERELPEASTSGALAMWLLFHVQRVASVTTTLRKACFEMDEQLDDGIDNVELEDLVSLKNRVNQIIAVSEEQLECVENLKEGETMTSGLDFSKLRGSMGLVMATAGANERMSGRLEKKVADLRTTYDSHQQDRINQRLEVLTILSAIFLPLTLMAGLWGMNFTNMPELQRQNAYYFALSGMFAVALILIFTFYRFGWFRR